MKSSKLSLLATVAILFTPVAAFAQDSQVSVQGNQNSAAAIGTQLDVGGYVPHYGY